MLLFLGNIVYKQRGTISIKFQNFLMNIWWIYSASKAKACGIPADCTAEQLQRDENASGRDSSWQVSAIAVSLHRFALWMDHDGIARGEESQTTAVTLLHLPSKLLHVPVRWKHPNKNKGMKKTHLLNSAVLVQSGLQPVSTAVQDQWYLPWEFAVYVRIWGCPIGTRNKHELA